MKTIGIIGGTSWESSLEYYRLLNTFTKEILGKKHSARIIMYSFDWMEIEELFNKNDFEKIGERLTEEGVNLEKAGADLLMLGANTQHLWYDKISESMNIPIVHIGDATGRIISETGVKKVLLLGTKFTMEKGFLKDKLKSDYNISALVPDQPVRQKIHDIIFNELLDGKFTQESKQFFLEVINCTHDIEGVILACTELPILIKDSDCNLPLFNTTAIHARAVVDLALKEN